jgi:hypothetical protein
MSQSPECTAIPAHLFPVQQLESCVSCDSNLFMCLKYNNPPQLFPIITTEGHLSSLIGYGPTALLINLTMTWLLESCLLSFLRALLLRQLYFSLSELLSLYLASLLDMAPTTHSAASNAPDEPPAASSDLPAVIIIPPTTQPAGKLFISECYLTSSGWPEGLILKLHKSNWTEWCQHLELLAARTGFTKWLNNTIPCPDESLYPKAAMIWDSNDNSLWAFILEHISVVDFELVKCIDVEGQWDKIDQCYLIQ